MLVVFPAVLGTAAGVVVVFPAVLGTAPGVVVAVGVGVSVASPGMVVGDVMPPWDVLLGAVVALGVVVREPPVEEVPVDEAPVDPGGLGSGSCLR